MAMDPRDLQLPDGTRAPVNRIAPRGTGAVTTRARSFKHRALGQALAGFGIPKVRTKP